MFRNQRVWMFVKSKLSPALLLQCVLSPSNVLLWSTKQPWNECPNQNDLCFFFFSVDMMLSCQSGGSLLKYIHLAIEFVGPGWLWLACSWIHFLTSTTLGLCECKLITFLLLWVKRRARRRDVKGVGGGVCSFWWVLCWRGLQNSGKFQYIPLFPKNPGWSILDFLLPFWFRESYNWDFGKTQGIY